MTKLVATQGTWRHTACGTQVAWDAEGAFEFCPRCLTRDPLTRYDQEQTVEREIGFCEVCFRVRYLAFPGRAMCTQCRREAGGDELTTS